MTKKEATKIYNKRKRENFIDGLKDTLPMVGIMVLVLIPISAFISWPYIISWVTHSRFWEIFSYCWIGLLVLGMIIMAIACSISEKMDERKEAIEDIMMRHNNEK